MKTKLMTLVVMCIIATATSFAQTSEKTHKIEKGETIESIAQKYGVTPDEIKKANPNAGNYFYTGMSIKIPAKKTEVAEPTTIQPEPTNAIENKATNNSHNYVAETPDKDNNYYSEKSSNDDSFTKWNFIDEVGYGFINSDASVLNFSLGFTYSIKKPLFLAVQLGYKSYSYNKYLKDYKMTMDTEASYLSIPLEVGYKITTENGKWGIAPFAGLGFNIGLKGKQKINEHLDGREEYKLKIGGKIGVEGRIGLRILLANFQIIGSYHLPLNKKQEQFFGEDAYPELSIGFGF